MPDFPCLYLLGPCIARQVVDTLKIHFKPSRAVCKIIIAQVQHLQLLAKLYIRRGRHDLASQIWEILAMRRSGVADQAVLLSQRQEAYQNAVIEVRL